MNKYHWLLYLFLLTLVAAEGPAKASRAPANMIPLIDMGAGTYLGFDGGLFPDQSNSLPTRHGNEGFRRTGLIQPLDIYGNLDPDGKYIFLSIGMSNTATEFCSNEADGTTCFTHSFMSQARQDPAVNQTHLVMVNGARAGRGDATWIAPDTENYGSIEESLQNLGLSPMQVQIIWLKVATPQVTYYPSLPSPKANAFTLLGNMGEIVRRLKVQYPNLQQVFVSSRIYAGYADPVQASNPEPYAYESGFAVKWLIESQIRQMQNEPLPHNGLAGDLNYQTVAPWISWGPYMWADGLNPRSDGLIWTIDDFVPDGMHPSQLGEEKVAAQLLTFFKQSRQTKPWFLNLSLP